MAPLIDVVFLLLVFFMLTSTFENPSLPLALPAADSNVSTPPEAVEIHLDREGILTLDGERVTLESFSEVLAEKLVANPNKPVAFHGDREADFGLFVDLMGRAKKAGASQFHVVHEQPSAP